MEYNSPHIFHAVYNANTPKVPFCACGRACTCNLFAARVIQDDDDDDDASLPKS